MINRLVNNAMSFLLLIAIHAGCAKKNTERMPANIEYIGYGTSFGECLGYCNNSITVSASIIEFQKSGWGSEGMLNPVAVSDAMGVEQWELLIEKIEFSRFMQLDAVIGCPDCADGGAEWIEIKKNQRTHKIVFEYGNAPDQITDYVGYLRTFMQAFDLDSTQEVSFRDRVWIERQARIKRFTCSRGCYQYLIERVSEQDTACFFATPLDEAFHADDLEIVLSGVLTYDSTVIYRPASNDAPEVNFKVRNMKVQSMRALD